MAWYLLKRAKRPDCRLDNNNVPDISRLERRVLELVKDDLNVERDASQHLIRANRI